MIKNSPKKGFTLIEVLIAASLFVIVSTLTTMILFNIISTEKKSNILTAVYDDSRIIMEQLATMIHDNAVDYDEYYSVNVIQPKLVEGSTISSVAYGMYHGVYSGRFYDPGQAENGSAGKNPEDLGVICLDGVPPTSISKCKTISKLSKDTNTGKNPYQGGGAEEDTSNAFCDENMASPLPGNCNEPKTSEGFVDDEAKDELYLINAGGNKKTIVVRQTITTSPENYAIGMLELKGIDSDQNGITDLFTCEEDYNCGTVNINKYLVDALGGTFPSIPDEDAITDLGLSIATRVNKDLDFDVNTSSFVPITPFRSNVVSLKFIITPVEDPYKAYAEREMQSHPSVTILLTMEPSAAEKAKYPGGNPPQLVIQRTVTAGVHQKVESYPPTNDLSWIGELIPSE
ncbi:MAG: type II secretion system protein [Candidatus Gracilibacteria bacterium]|jgi:prepilin-type N-terminal cleavage/methylation domain-containing protein